MLRITRRDAIAVVGAIGLVGLPAGLAICAEAQTTSWGAGNLLIDCPKNWKKIDSRSYELYLMMAEDAAFGIVEDTKTLGVTKKSVKRTVKNVCDQLEKSENLSVDADSYAIEDIELGPSTFTTLATVPFVARRKRERFEGVISCVAVTGCVYAIWAYAPEGVWGGFADAYEKAIQSASYFVPARDKSLVRKLLEKAVDQALELDPGAFSEDSFATLESALSYAQGVLQDANADLEALESALSLLKDAVSMLREEGALDE